MDSIHAPADSDEILVINETIFVEACSHLRQRVETASSKSEMKSLQA